MQGRDAKSGRSQPAAKVEISVSAEANEKGDYRFVFGGSEYVASNGDIDLRKIPTAVELVFQLSSRSEAGLRFARPAENAIALVLDRLSEKGRCPSSGASEQDQFSKFLLSRDRRTLRVFNRNNDQQDYRYALNFTNAKGCAVVFDPMIRNDGGGGDQ